MKVFVTDGQNRAALAVTRALGRLGHHVVVGDRRLNSIAQASRYCRHRVAYPDPVKAPDAFVDALAALTRELDIDVLIPVADITTFLVTGHRFRFGCDVPCASADVVARAANKVEIVATAERIGVPVPRSVVVRCAHEVPSVEHLGYPLLVKPWQSRIRTADGWASTSVSYADSHAQLKKDLERRPAYEFPVLLQERLVGPGVGVFACYHEGQSVALFSHRRLRERPPWGGVSVLCASAAVDPAAGSFATRLLDEIEWQGVAMVEFKRDERDGVPKLMEINGRFWGSLQLAIDSGVDFPALLMQTVTGEPFAPQPPYKVGLRERWWWGDVDALLLSLLPGANAARVAGRSKLQAVREFLKFRAPDLHYDNPKWDDWRPFASETRSWFGNFAPSVQSASEAVPVPDHRRLPSSSTRPALRIRLASSFADAGIDESVWNDLVARGETDSVFQTHEWATSSWATYSQGRTLLLATASDDSGIRAIAPLVIDKRPGRGRVGLFVGTGRADYSDVLAPAGEAALVEALVNEVLASDQWDSLDLYNIPERSRAISVIEQCSKRGGFPVIVDNAQVCPTLMIEGCEAEAMKILNKPSLRRRRNGFTRTGSLVVRHLTRAEEIEPLLDQFFDQHIRRWADTPSPSLFLKAEHRTFYRTLTQNLSPTNWLLFTVVEHDGVPVAFHYGFDRRGVVTWYKPSFDPQFASRSPGLTLLQYLIEFAVSNRRRELDFSLGDEAFKTRFTNQVRRTVRLRIFRDTLGFNVARTVRGLRAAASRVARA